MEVIKGLRPQPNLRILSIGFYQGLTFPSWLEVSSLPKLVAVSLWSCGKCQDLPSFGRLPFLRKLRLHNMKSIKFIDKNGVVEGFTSLEELELHYMPILEGWSLLKVNEESDVILLPCLKKLSIKNCPKLRKLLFSFSLESLYLWGCGELVKDLPSLSSLQIYDFNEHISFPEELTTLPDGMRHIDRLHALSIMYCKNLRFLPAWLQHFTCLKTLEIEKCHPELHRRCKKESGEDWPKIAHIPSKYNDSLKE
ncbi:hypothetical protein IFM89_017112, partial [Coptis chinensis]